MKHRPHIKVEKDAEKEDTFMIPNVFKWALHGWSK